MSNCNVNGFQLTIELAGLNADDAKLLTIRLKKYQEPAGMLVNVTGGIAVLMLYGLPLDWIAVVPAKIRCDSVGVANAEYQISAYCVIPDDAVVATTLNDGIDANGWIALITGAGTVPKNVGSPIPVFGAGVNCVIFTSS